MNMTKEEYISLGIDLDYQDLLKSTTPPPTLLQNDNLVKIGVLTTDSYKFITSSDFNGKITPGDKNCYNGYTSSDTITNGTIKAIKSWSAMTGDVIHKATPSPTLFTLLQNNKVDGNENKVLIEEDGLDDHTSYNANVNTYGKGIYVRWDYSWNTYSEYINIEKINKTLYDTTITSSRGAKTSQCPPFAHSSETHTWYTFLRINVSTSYRPQFTIKEMSE